MPFEMSSFTTLYLPPPHDMLQTNYHFLLTLEALVCSVGWLESIWDERRTQLEGQLDLELRPVLEPFLYLSFPYRGVWRGAA